MKQKKILMIIWLILVGFTGTRHLARVEAVQTEGQVNVEVSEKTLPFDPEDPLKIVDPGVGPSTEGLLRIDFVSAINFANTKITENNRTYASLAQLFHDETTARGAYIQITDLRGGKPGWALQLKQETQFKNGDNVALNGAVLSFDQGWANSGGTGQAPAVFRDTIAIDAIGSAYVVATADPNKGNGTWLISFGASATNQKGQKNTLTALKDETGRKVIDPEFQKEAFTNAAITLAVPTNIDILPGDYTTQLTWLLQATP